MARDRILNFLMRNPKKLFSPAEISEALGIWLPDLNRRLNALLLQNRVVRVHDQYGMPTRSLDSKQMAPLDIEEVASRIGIDPRVIREWMEEKKNRAVDEALKKILYEKLRESVEKLGPRRNK